LLNTTTYDDYVVLHRIAAGDEEAFRQLFHHYNKLLRPFVVKLTRSTQAAEEVLQEVFLKIWLHREKLVDVENPRAYILRIVSNESMNYLRALVKDHRLIEEIGQSPIVESPSPEQSIFYRETEQLIDEAIGQLPQACRQIYRMSREQYKRIPEIASELNLSNHTVKNQLVKALRIIRLRIAHIMPLLLVCLFARR
jgi:RNA polymerase sigma-70 factor (family 1)